MWIRSAFWIGVARVGYEDKFRIAMNDELIPALRLLPGVRDAKALWPRRYEDDPPKVSCQVLVEFASRADVEQMLASPERQALRARVREVASMFDGAISHIDYEVAR